MFGSSIGGSLLVTGLSTVQLNSSSNNLTLNTITVRGGDLNAGSKLLAVQALIMESVNATLRGTGSISSATTYELRAGNVSVPLIGPAGLRKSTAGNVLLTTTNSYAGPTTIEQGGMTVQTSGGLGAGAVDVRAAGTLNLAGTQTIASLTNSGSWWAVQPLYN